MMYNNYILNRNYKLFKTEILQKTPDNRVLYGLYIHENDFDLTVNIKFNSQIVLFAIDYMDTLLSDTFKNIEKITFNDINVPFEIKILDINLITNNILEKNIFKIKYKDFDSIAYENGCIIHKVYNDGDEDDLNWIIESWNL